MCFYYETIYKSCIWISLSENKEGYREYFRINYSETLIRGGHPHGLLVEYQINGQSDPNLTSLLPLNFDVGLTAR